MKVAWIPLYPIWGASSRLRVYSIHEELLRLGYNSIIGFDPQADILVVQKHQNLGDNIKSFKGKIIYDGDDREVWGAISKNIEIVDAVTTDTEGHRNEIFKVLPEDKHHRVYVLPDTIDYYPEKPLPAVDREGVCWFGFYGNLLAASEYLEYFSTRTQVRLITNGVEVDWAETVGWGLDSFISSLRESSIALLSHSIGDVNKSNNKMITAITHGLPCIVSSTPEYTELAYDAGVGWSVVSNLEQAIEAFTRLSTLANREKYLAKIQPLVWERYNIKETTKRFLELCNAL